MELFSRTSASLLNNSRVLTMHACICMPTTYKDSPAHA